MKKEIKVGKYIHIDDKWYEKREVSEEGYQMYLTIKKVFNRYFKKK